jgi:hypothetical protein
MMLIVIYYIGFHAQSYSLLHNSESETSEILNTIQTVTARKRTVFLFHFQYFDQTSRGPDAHAAHSTFLTKKIITVGVGGP